MYVVKAVYDGVGFKPKQPITVNTAYARFDAATNIQRLLTYLWIGGVAAESP